MKTRDFLVILLVFVGVAYCNASGDILGCGGFIKSHVPLDFSKVSIKLLTKQGTLKEKTECAPNNGYYFVPLYETGEYILKVEPPAGWSVQPSEVSINVDGTTDKCSLGQDINFSFTGFGITGKIVTAGQDKGPAGVSVQLVSSTGETRTTTTTFNGDFHFTPVIPGKYTVKASHPKWKLEPSSTIVQVTSGNTALKVGSLAVKGYDVKGKVVSDGKPISGVYVLLYAEKGTNPQFKIEGCLTSLLQGVSGNPICHVISTSSGEFSFGLVPAGKYSLVALQKPPGQNKIVYNIKPSKLEFKVEHAGVDLENSFEITGFTIEGRLLIHPGGAGYSGAQILLNGNAVSKTNKDGYYTLSNLKASTYTIQAKASNCEFDDIAVGISSNGVVSLNDHWPSKWKVCGYIKSPAGSGNNRLHDVIIQQSPPPVVAPLKTKMNDAGKWCLFLSPGVYLASVDISDEDRRDGLQFFPLSQKINVGYGPIDGVIFSQLKAKLSGNLKCMNDGQPTSSCLNTVVTLRPLSLDGNYVGQPLKATAKDGKYSFSEILPGSYEVSVPSDNLCWSSAKHNVAVTSAEALVPDFVHTGYAVSFAMSHKSKVSYVNGPSKGSLEIPAGVSQHCLPKSGDYVFTAEGCHTYEPSSLTYKTGQSNNMLTITAVAHSIGISILSNDLADDLKLKLVLRDNAEEIAVPKLSKDKKDGKFVYHHTLMMPQGSSIQVTPISGILLFSPSGTRTLVANGGDCIDVGLLLNAKKGQILSGAIIPPIKDVKITLKKDDDEGKAIVFYTNEDGKYSFGPLDASIKYTLLAEKESFVLTGPNPAGNFHAQKLAKIIVSVSDSATNEPLESALVSVSGGISYRKNMATGIDGTLSFPSLAPDEYYVKPLMKEYRFDPPHRIIKVKEGETHEVKLSGIRVACSGVGVVSNLGGGGIGGAIVIAEPAPNADPSKCPAEEAIAERDTGAFRVRGLLRGCSYRMKLKMQSELGIVHVIPQHIELEINSEAEDIDGLKFVAVQSLSITDVSVLVYTPKVEHYKTLKLRLAAEVEPTSSIYSAKLDGSGYAPGINPGLKLTMPRLPADNKTYFLQVDSSLSKSTHQYSSDPIYFVSDGKFKHFDINFEPKAKTSEQDVNQPSFLILPLLGFAIFAYFNKEKVLDAASGLVSSISDKFTVVGARSKQNNAKNVQSMMDESQIDQIVQNINNTVKKRPKPRKV